LPLLTPDVREFSGKPLVYHAACHAEWPGAHKVKGRKQLLRGLTRLTGSPFRLSPGCCSESGLGAMTSPGIYNVLRDRKRNDLAAALEGYDGPVLVGCPSCKLGIGRVLLSLRDKRPVLHAAEWLAAHLDGLEWRQSFCRKVNASRGDVRIVPVAQATTPVPPAPAAEQVADAAR
ncbi:MAG: (Fe-S)-binding protein, partial [Ottowia sp.]|nr:(Fe-S)-binding protein [Ottowia sp.]